MPNEVTDKKAEYSLNISVIIQALMLAGIIGTVTILIDIKDSIASLSAYTKVNESRINDHERRLSLIEDRLGDHRHAK